MYESELVWCGVWHILVFVSKCIIIDEIKKEKQGYTRKQTSTLIWYRNGSKSEKEKDKCLQSETQSEDKVITLNILIYLFTFCLFDSFGTIAISSSIFFYYFWILGFFFSFIRRRHFMFLFIFMKTFEKKNDNHTMLKVLVEGRIRVDGKGCHWIFYTFLSLITFKILINITR